MSNDSGAGVVGIVAIVILVLGALFFFIPMMKDKTGSNINIPDKVDVNLK